MLKLCAAGAVEFKEYVKLRLPGLALRLAPVTARVAWTATGLAFGVETEIVQL
jgi:hypothetical protein